MHHVFKRPKLYPQHDVVLLQVQSLLKTDLCALRLIQKLHFVLESFAIVEFVFQLAQVAQADASPRVDPRRIYAQVHHEILQAAVELPLLEIVVADQVVDGAHFVGEVDGFGEVARSSVDEVGKFGHVRLWVHRRRHQSRDPLQQLLQVRRYGDVLVRVELGEAVGAVEVVQLEGSLPGQ